MYNYWILSLKITIILFVLNLCSACSDYNSRQFAGYWQKIIITNTTGSGIHFQLNPPNELDTIVDTVFFNPNHLFEGSFPKLKTTSFDQTTKWKFIPDQNILEFSYITDSFPIQLQDAYTPDSFKLQKRSDNSWEHEFYDNLITESFQRSFEVTIQLSRIDIDTTLWGY